MSNESIIKNQIEAYRENFLLHKDSPRGTHQNNRETQYLRFERLLASFKEGLIKTATLHDFGCGICDLHEYLSSRHIHINYSGTEIVGEMVELVRLKFPHIQVFNRDIISEQPNEKHDFVVSSGVFNLPGGTPLVDWKQFVFDAVDAMFRMSNKAISFNMLTTYSTFSDPNLFYMDPKEMVDYCIRKHSRFVSLDQGYPLFEWTLTVWKPEAVEVKYAQPQYLKYFKQQMK